MGQATLETRRLRLVPLAEEHSELIVELDSDPEVMRYLAAGPSSRETAVEAHRYWCSVAQHHPGLGVWAGFTAGEFVGWWLLRPRGPTSVPGEVELGYRLMRRFWRRGLASEGAREVMRHAFESLGFSRVYAGTMAVNTASRATMASIGMHHDRTFHRDRTVPLPGSDEGEVEYAITRSEWLGRQERVRSQGLEP